MIKRIFWDIDETLIHTLVNREEENTKHFILPDSAINYYTIIRPCSNDLIEFSRNLVGKENVYILTTATRDYAERVNELAEWDFPVDQIIPREDIQDYTVSVAWGYSYENQTMRHPLADKNNVLIDNLIFRHNEKKVSLIGIDRDRYLNVRDYYGVNFPDDTFEEDVKNFLTKANQ